jgi:hypothetical protein
MPAKRLPHPGSGKLLSEASQSQIAVVSVDGIVVAGLWQGNGMRTVCVNSSLNGMETAGERHGKSRKTALIKQGNGMVSVNRPL